MPQAWYRCECGSHTAIEFASMVQGIFRSVTFRSLTAPLTYVTVNACGVVLYDEAVRAGVMPELFHLVRRRVPRHACNACMHAFVHACTMQGAPPLAALPALVMQACMPCAHPMHACSTSLLGQGGRSTTAAACLHPPAPPLNCTCHRLAASVRGTCLCLAAASCRAHITPPRHTHSWEAWEAHHAAHRLPTAAPAALRPGPHPRHACTSRRALTPFFRCASCSCIGFAGGGASVCTAPRLNPKP